jgi:hypothetical protein
MNFDFSAIDLLLASEASLPSALDHPAYRTVAHHACWFGSEIDEEAVKKALGGERSSFYGLENLDENRERIRVLQAVIRENQTEWLNIAENELGRLFPHEDFGGITVYPILGYDAGIGLQEKVCMNLNWPPYLADPLEFLFYLLHEVVHVIYERHHPIPAFRQVTTPRDWEAYFGLWTQNEGYAVYAPLRLRMEMERMGDRDYQALLNQDTLREHIEDFLEVRRSLKSEKELGQNEYLEAIFGSKRLTYRVGCELVRRIRKIHGEGEVRRAFYLNGDEFLEEYINLLSE